MEGTVLESSLEVVPFLQVLEDVLFLGVGVVDLIVFVPVSASCFRHFTHNSKSLEKIMPGPASYFSAST